MYQILMSDQAPNSNSKSKPRQRKFAPRSRTGCLTCRARRKRCDGQGHDDGDSGHVRCANCNRLNLACEWQSRQTLDRLPVTTISSSTPPPRSLSAWDALPLDQASDQQHLLQYYVEAFVPSVSVAPTPTSFYTSLYMPWAFHIEGMLHAILAISSAQLARRTSNQLRAQHLKSVSYSHQEKCYTFIRDRVPRAGGLPRDTYQVVAVILILVGLEALNGIKTCRWISKLRSVQRILSSLTSEQAIVDCVEIDALHRHFTYHFASASLMAPIADAAPSSTTPDHHVAFISPQILPAAIDPLMGISYQLCHLISRIQYVTWSNLASPHTAAASFHAIESAIQAWSCSNPYALGVDLPIALDLIALAEAYRLAALIQLYRGSPAHTALIPTCASRAIDFVVRIPPGSPAESSLLYPIFLAGAELEDREAIGICFKRLEDIQKRNRYENVDMVQKVLKEVWRPKLQGGQKRNWEHILKEWNWSFTLG